VLEAQLLVEMDGRPALAVGQQVQPVGHAHGLGPLQRRRQQELADLAAARGLQHAHLGQLEPAVLHLHDGAGPHHAQVRRLREQHRAALVDDQVAGVLQQRDVVLLEHEHLLRSRRR
jgi:hypothetical protein